MNLTQHFTLAEMIRSGAAVRLNISNEPSAEVVENLRLLCENILEPLRRRFGVIRITSGYRCQALNQAVGGVGHSQHLCGEAADIHVSNREVGLKMYISSRKHCPTISSSSNTERATAPGGFTFPFIWNAEERKFNADDRKI